METKANFVMLGAATVVGVIMIMLFALWLANSDLRRGYNEFDVVFADPVRGLAEGGEVRFNGIKVGEVHSLRIDPENNNVIARIRVSTDIRLRKDSEARLEPVGLTGVTLIQLSAGSANEQLVRASFGGPTPRLTGKGSQIDILVERSEDIAMRASEAMAAVRDLLTDENIAKVSGVISDLQAISHRLADQRSVIARSGEAAASMRDAADSIAALARQTQTDLATLDATMIEVHQAAQVASGQTLPQMTLATEQIRDAAASIARVANNIEENPSVLTPRSPRPTVELPR